MLKLFGGLASNRAKEEDESNYGDDSYTEAKVKQSGLLDNIKRLDSNLGKDVLTLLEKIASKGKPYDDRTFMVR